MNIVVDKRPDSCSECVFNQNRQSDGSYACYFRDNSEFKHYSLFCIEYCPIITFDELIALKFGKHIYHGKD